MEDPRFGGSCLTDCAPPGCSDEDDDGVVRWGGDDEADGEGGEDETIRPTDRPPRQ